jgi:hypothetical protein
MRPQLSKDAEGCKKVKKTDLSAAQKFSKGYSIKGSRKIGREDVPSFAVASRKQLTVTRTPSCN